jgi:hypothetical protein
MRAPQQVNPYKASKLRDSDVSQTAFPVVTKTELKHILSDQTPDEECNMEIRHHCLGYAYLKNARIHLTATMRLAKTPNHEYEDRMKEVIALLQQVEKRWPIEWK